MRLVVALLLAFAASPVAAQTRFFVEAYFSGSSCPQPDPSSITSYTAYPAGQCIVSSSDSTYYQLSDCQNGTLISLTGCDSTCATCSFNSTRPFLNGGNVSECTNATTYLYFQGCIVGQPTYPTGAPIAAYYNNTKCSGVPFSIASSKETTICTDGAKEFCSGGSAVAETWNDANCSTSIKLKVSTHRFCTNLEQDTQGQQTGSYLTYCAAHSLLSAPLLVAGVVFALSMWL